MTKLLCAIFGGESKRMIYETHRINKRECRDQARRFYRLGEYEGIDWSISHFSWITHLT